MTDKQNNKVGTNAKRRTCFLLLFALVLSPAAAGDFRNIAACTFDYYFDDTWSITMEDVFLARVAPFLTFQAKVTHENTGYFYTNIFGLGPIINFSDNFYLDAIYGLGIDSDNHLSHRGEINLNYENDTAYFMIGVRGYYFPDISYNYLLPTVGGKFRVLDWLELFSKIFFSIDNRESVSGSYWGELYWIVDPAVTLRTGFTLGYGNEFGYGVLAGVNVEFSEHFSIRYAFQFLNNTTDYFSSPEQKYGIQNSLLIDLKF